MQIAYWVVAGLLALFYAWTGLTKITRSKDQLRPMMKWVDRFPLPFVRTVGTLEVLAAVGLILPPLTWIAPWLAFAAAIGLILLQIGAIITHLTSRDDRQIAINLVVIAISGVVVWLATVWL